MELKIDLHCHTRYSDGSAPLHDVLTMAARRGINMLAITDHDTMAGCKEAVRLGEKLGVRVLPGVEISARDEERGRKVHILCYAPQFPEILQPMLDKTLQSRRQGMAEAVEIVTQLYPVTKEMILQRAEGATCLYKQHVMQTLMDAGFAGTIFGDTFRELFNSKTGPAYRPVQYPDVFTAIETARCAGGKVVLAHPSEYDSLELLQTLCERGLLDGIEIEHPRNQEEDKPLMHALADRCGLAKTGGTDFHGYFTTRKNPVGTCLTAPAEFDKLFKTGKENIV